MLHACGDLAYEAQKVLLMLFVNELYGLRSFSYMQGIESITVYVPFLNRIHAGRILCEVWAWKLEMRSLSPRWRKPFLWNPQLPDSRGLYQEVPSCLASHTCFLMNVANLIMCKCCIPDPSPVCRRPYGFQREGQGKTQKEECREEEARQDSSNAFSSCFSIQTEHFDVRS